MSGTAFLFKHCDGKFTDEDLNDQGNAFAKEYYGDDGDYMQDYAGEFGELMYLKPEGEHDFRRFSEMMETHLKRDARREANQPPSPQKPKTPWWKFW